MANNLGLFQWIREGVRQSVLLGVTDALESIGSPDDASKLHPALMSLSSTRQEISKRQRAARSSRDAPELPLEKDWDDRSKNWNQTNLQADRAMEPPSLLVDCSRSSSPLSCQTA